MSRRVDQRYPKDIDLDAYDNILELTRHLLSVCKPKENKDNSNKHIPKRYVHIAKTIENLVLDIGADIIEANCEYDVRKNVEVNQRARNYESRINLWAHARSLTFRLEHVIRVMHYTHQFADSTLTYTMRFLVAVRDGLNGLVRKETEILHNLCL